MTSSHLLHRWYYSYATFIFIIADIWKMALLEFKSYIFHIASSTSQTGDYIPVSVSIDRSVDKRQVEHHSRDCIGFCICIRLCAFVMWFESFNEMHFGVEFDVFFFTRNFSACTRSPF